MAKATKEKTSDTPRGYMVQFTHDSQTVLADVRARIIKKENKNLNKSQITNIIIREYGRTNGILPNE